MTKTTPDTLGATSPHHMPWLDVAKGIGIFLVMTGHMMCPCHDAIDMFHMPLFFVLAGITFSTRQSTTPWLIGKINRLFVPYVFFTLISWILSMATRAINSGSPIYGGPFNGPLWFFPVMLGALVMVRYMLRCPLWVQWAGVIGALAFTWWGAANTDYSYNAPLMSSTVFISAAFLWAGTRMQWLRHSLDKPGSALGACLISGAIFATLYLCLKSHWGISGSYVTFGIYRHALPLAVACSMAGVLLTIAASKLIRSCRPLQWMGRNTIPLMCVHFPMSQYLNTQIANIIVYQHVNTGGG